MPRPPSLITFLAVTTIATLGIAACSSDDEGGSSEPNTAQSATVADPTSAVSAPDLTVADTLPDVSLPDVSLPDVSLPAGLTIPDGVTIPDVGALDERCQDYYRLFASAFTGDTSSLGELDDAIADIREQVPDDLRDDVDVVGTAVDTLAELSEEHQGNPAGLYSDPEAVAVFSDPALVQSSQELTTWLSSECAAG